MRRRILAILAAGTALLALVAPAAAEQPTTQPAKTLLEQVHQLVQQTQTFARWGCIFAGLALLGVLWIIFFRLQTLAKNQLELARMIQARKEQ